MNPSDNSAHPETARAVGPPHRAARHHRRRPRRRRPRGRARPQPVGGYPAAQAQNLTEQAHKLQAPIGFADIVEKVKPAVISVRVKIDGGPQTSGFSSNNESSARPARVLPPLRHARHAERAAGMQRGARP